MNLFTVEAMILGNNVLLELDCFSFLIFYVSHDGVNIHHGFLTKNEFYFIEVGVLFYSRCYILQMFTISK